MEHAVVLAQKASRPGRRHPLGAVIEWELRRLATHRGLWLLAGGLFVVFTGLFPLAHMAQRDVVPDPVLPMLSFIVLIGGCEAQKVAFIVLCMGLIAGEVQSRTHELMMATALPTWAYVWGRWLAGLILCSAFSLLVLGGVLAGNWIVSLADPAGSLPPNMGAILSVWGALAAVDVPVISALALVAGACWPRRVLAVPAGLTVLCILGPQLALTTLTHSGRPSGIGAWVPNHLLLAADVLSQYYDRLLTLLAPHGYGLESWPAPDVLIGFWRNAWAGPVDLSFWLPQVGYGGLGIALIALLAWRFRRFRMET